ncbi:hypothetical protein QD46_18640 [Paenibacillus polymyxa]|uniref:hypothetical protein n=2 Tax=Paenibacillus polymyxa TaxID=1406 RepID=UPI0005CF1D2F|nr:hypothetical protein [Paenibacillus polymyxa]KJD38482.1 hypothetical protein QD46_18640 [Paenibacillus polymyxa]MCJ1220271.1 hypothetical protein [Paenibacillus polymyxa]
MKWKLQINLKETGWSVDHNTYYIDKDELKGREIDLVVTYFLSNPVSVLSSDYFELHFVMPIEIKLANKKPWVFFSSETTPFEQLMNNQIIKSSVGFKSEHHLYYELIKNHGTTLNENLGRSFYEAFSGNGSRDDIYKALTGTIKTLEHLIEDCSHDEEKSEEYSSRYLYLYEPTILVKGSMYVAKIENENILIEETDYVQVAFNYLSPNYKKKDYIVHVINHEKLPQYISSKESKMKLLYKKLSELEGISLEEVDFA